MITIRRPKAAIIAFLFDRIVLTSISIEVGIRLCRVMTNANVPTNVSASIARGQDISNMWASIFHNSFIFFLPFLVLAYVRFRAKRAEKHKVIREFMSTRHGSKKSRQNNPPAES